DGIDLPDNACRVLFFDSKPYSEGVVDRYTESCRATSNAIATKTARRIEQGLGRSVRGEKDYCVFVLLGASLIKTVLTKGYRNFLMTMSSRISTIADGIYKRWLAINTQRARTIPMNFKSVPTGPTGICCVQSTG